uniref:adenylyl-sulfate kinase n=1 Tax=Phocaeicola dorei TaxID=357276 RepID=UPI004026D43E
MLTFKMIIVFFGLIGMVTALVLDKMRPGMILFSVTVLFLCFGILTPKEILEGFSNKGMITVALLFLISEGVRQMATRIIGAENFLEIYVSTPLEECEKRDVKGLYAKARRGEIKNFTGISAPFEAPERPALSLDTSKLSLEESVNTLLELVLPTVGKKGEKI